MEEDPDVFVLGSRNGLGKTSVLECCALLYCAATVGKKFVDLFINANLGVNFPELLIRSGKQEAQIQGEFLAENTVIPVSLVLPRSGKPKLQGEFQELERLRHKMLMGPILDFAERFFSSLMGFSSDPLLLTPFMYFHSYRKVREGNPELGMMVREKRTDLVWQGGRRDSLFPIGSFKLELLISIMAQASLFENIDDTEDKLSFDKLNQLVFRYTDGGTIAKLRALPDNTIDFRINSGHQSFTFDGLSSGQKEIISTLYMVWRHTRETSGMVLIDEPELHLNSEWQIDFLKQLQEVAPGNQYILATHSDLVFGSAPEDHRIFLTTGVPSE
jgi:hypothetical protein